MYGICQPISQHTVYLSNVKLSKQMGSSQTKHQNVFQTTDEVNLAFAQRKFSSKKLLLLKGTKKFSALPNKGSTSAKTPNSVEISLPPIIMLLIHNVRTYITA